MSIEVRVLVDLWGPPVAPITPEGESLCNDPPPVVALASKLRHVRFVDEGLTRRCALCSATAVLPALPVAPVVEAGGGVLSGVVDAVKGIFK